MRDIGNLINSITDGSRAAHAFIIEGRPGEKRREFIGSLIAGLECTDPDPRRRPCGTCPACRQVAAGTSMDVVRMNMSGKSSYKTEDAAGLIERLSMGAYGRFLIGVIDDADLMTEIVQNKLLKTLEEPGRDTILILAASNRDNLLDTVRSRCSDIRLADYAEADDEEQAAPGALVSLADMLSDKDCEFYRFREAADKNIKSREDALRLLDMFEDAMRQQLQGDGRLSPARAAECIEIASICRMDIHRDMGYGKALRRLFLELR